MGRNQGESWQDYAGRLEVENADLRERVATLEDMVNRLLKRVDELERAGKRQASPFSKGDPKEKPKKPGRKKGGKGCRRRRVPARPPGKQIRSGSSSSQSSTPITWSARRGFSRDGRRTGPHRVRGTQPPRERVKSLMNLTRQLEHFRTAMPRGSGAVRLAALAPSGVRSARSMPWCSPGMLIAANETGFTRAVTTSLPREYPQEELAMTGIFMKSITLAAGVVLTALLGGCATPTRHDGTHPLHMNHISTQAEAEALRPGDCLAMVCSMCRNVVFHRVGSDTTHVDLLTVGESHTCSDCKGDVRVVGTGEGSGKSEKVKHVCSNCGADAMFVCATRPGSGGR